MTNALREGEVQMPVVGKELSDKIAAVRFPLACLVVLIHSQQHHARCFPVAHLVQDLLSKQLAAIAVPCFFVISGFLTYSEGDVTYLTYKGKIRRRLRSLFLPFIVWNAIVIVQQALGHAVYGMAVRVRLEPALAAADARHDIHEVMGFDADGRRHAVTSGFGQQTCATAACSGRAPYAHSHHTAVPLCPQDGPLAWCGNATAGDNVALGGGIPCIRCGRAVDTSPVLDAGCGR